MQGEWHQRRRGQESSGRRTTEGSERAEPCRIRHSRWHPKSYCGEIASLVKMKKETCPEHSLCSGDRTGSADWASGDCYWQLFRAASQVRQIFGSIVSGIFKR